MVVAQVLTNDVKQVSWNDLATPLKLQLYDIVVDDSESMDRLRLDVREVEELKNLVLARERRVNLERDEGAAHRSEVHDSLLRGALMSEKKFDEVANKNLFQHVGEEDEHYDVGYLSEAAELRKARAYLIHCRLPPNLLDRKWASIPKANAIALGYRESVNPSAATTIQHQFFRTPRDGPGLLKSPFKHSFAHARQFLTPKKQRPLGGQPSLSRRSSGFIRPSIELGTSTVVQHRRPQMGDFVHRPVPSTRLEHVRARNTAAEANIAAQDRQPTKLSRNFSAPSATARPPSVVRTDGEASTRNGVTALKRRASQEPEPSFLNSERRPGTRQTKSSMEAVNAELSSQITRTVRKKARTSGGSTMTDTPAPATTAPKDSTVGPIVDTSGGAEASAATSVDRKDSNDSAIDLTADNEIPNGAKVAKDTPNKP